ncbi:hypothetical protein JCM17823_24490 [Halorubrum gandharaense]
MTAVPAAVPLALDVTFGQPRVAAVTLLTFAVLSVFVAGASALAYRWYFKQEVPEGVAVILGVAVVALYLNTTSLGEVVGGDSPALLTPEGVFFNIVALALAAVVAPLGRYAGDRLAVDVFAVAGTKQFEGEMSKFVRTVGRVTTVTLPKASDIGDMDTYEPVSADKKAEMAEKTLVFPRKLTVEELRDRLVTRVKEDYGVGYVDVDLGDDGTLEFFAVGSRAAGIGPTLAPGAAAIAIAADPPNNATAGDMVQVWRTDPEPERVATAELRGVSEDVATVALDESDAAKLSGEGGYRLVTLPAEPQADREFASLLRNADETMAAVTVREGSDLVGSSVSDVGAVVAAVRPPEGSVQPIPSRAYTFGAGDLVYLVGRPDAIRQFEGLAAAPPAAPDDTTASEPLADEEPTDEPPADPATEGTSEGSGEPETDDSDPDSPSHRATE